MKTEHKWNEVGTKMESRCGNVIKKNEFGTEMTWKKLCIFINYV